MWILDDKKEEYTKESRGKICLDVARDREEEDKRKNPEKYKEKTNTSMFKTDGLIRQCNEGSGFSHILLIARIWYRGSNQEGTFIPEQPL